MLDFAMARIADPCRSRTFNGDYRLGWTEYEECWFVIGLGMLEVLRVIVF